MSTYSSLKFELILTGDQSGQWGNTTNTNIGTAINEAIAGSVDITFASADLTLTLTDTNASQSARNLRLNLIGTAGGAARTLTLGSGCQISKPYVVNNTLANAVTVKNTTGTGIAVPAGATMWLFNNGTNVVDVVSYLSSLTLGSALPVASGGTGQNTYAIGDLLYASTTSALSRLADVATGNALISGGVGIAPSWGKIGLTTHVDGTLPVANGGTALTSYTIGDLVYASGATTLAKLADVATGNALISGGVGIAPLYGKIGLTTHVDGTLAATNGGTGTNTTTAGDILYGAASNTWAKLAAGTAGQLLQTNGAGAPTWVNAPTFTGVSSFNAGTTGLTPSSASTGAVTLAGTLAVANGGTGVTTSTGTGDVVLSISPTLTTPALGTPASGNLANCTFPTLNQNTTGSAANLSGGSNYQIPYQLGGGTTFVPAPTTASTYLSWTGSGFVWSTVTPGSTFAGDISVNGLTVGRGTASIASNTALGYQANNAVTTSIGLTSVGYQANALCTTSDRHTAVGYQTNAAMTNMGSVGLDFEGNTAVGYKALQSNTGFVSFTSNTAVGAAAAQGLTTGYLNVSIGSAAGPTGSTASTVCVGQKAGWRYQGSKSVIIGASAYSQVVGAGAGSDIVVVGYETLYDATLGTSGATVDDTTAVGTQALRSIDPSGGVQSYRNTAVGSGAGYNLLSGTNNTLLGFNAQASTTTASNEFVLGNSSISVLRCQVSTISGLSDARDKYDIEDLPLGLDFINSLKARRFKWDKRDAYFDRVRDEDGRATQVAVPKDGSRKSDEWNEGFIAQEVDEAATAAGADWMRIVHKANPERLEMAPGKLIPVLVNAIQELTARLEALEARN